MRGRRGRPSEGVALKEMLRATAGPARAQRPGSGFQPEWVRAHARDCALSLIPGNCRRLWLCGSEPSPFCAPRANERRKRAKGVRALPGTLNRRIVQAVRLGH